MKRHRGFSFIELMIVVTLLSVIMAAVFSLINQAMQSSSVEQSKLDIFQEAREFMDMMSRDLRQAGYPNTRNIAASVITTNVIPNDPAVAVGIVYIDDGDLWFEGDVDNSGVVSTVRYHYDESTDGGCPCLKRSQQAKITGNPYTGQSDPVYEVQVQGVKNLEIFTAYSNGAAVTLPVTFAADGATIATIDTIQAVLTLEGTQIDPRTGLKPETTLISTVKINNCSLAFSGEILSCQ